MQVKPAVSNVSRKLVAVALLLLVLGVVPRAHAAGVFCSQFSEGGVQGVVDGNNSATLAALQTASTFGIDMNCTIKNFPQPMGGFPITNINFNFPQQQSYYIAFLDVYYYGHMSCNDPTQSDFWIYWAPGGFNNISPSCQTFMVPVDAVKKSNPPAQTTAAIGMPFTYTITVPLLGKLDSTGTFQYMANADDATVTNVVIPDDLTTAGAALSYVSNTAYLVNPSTGARTPLNGGAPLTLGASSTWLASHPGILSDSTKHLVFSYEYNPALASLPAGNNVEIDLTVVLDNNPTNSAGKQFTNTAKMWFNKPINSTSMADLEAWPGTTLPMTVVEPNLTLTKTGAATTVNAGAPVKYTLNVQNTGGGDAWNTTITDNFPAGMSTYSPVPTVTAQIFAADGVTPVSASLVNGTDFTLGWSGGGSSAGQLTFTMLNTTKIAPTQRLIITYQARIDSTGVASGTALTDIAGATRWFSANSTYAGRREYDRTITDGTPGILDFQDAYTVKASTYYFQKTVRNLTTGDYPASTALPGDRLRYTLLLQNFAGQPLNGITITDNLPVGLGSISNVTITPSGGSASVTQPSGGTPGSITITGLNLPGGAGTTSQIQIDFDATLDQNLRNGTIISNQANLTGTDSNGKTWSGPSDDPNVNGTVPFGSGGDPTLVTIQAPGAVAPAFQVLKTVQDVTSGTSTVMAGDTLRYAITVKNIGTENATGVTLRDLVPANTAYVANSTTLNGAAVADPSAGVSALQNGMLINSPANLTPGAMPARTTTNNIATVTFQVQISKNVVAGTLISNQGFVNGSGAASGPFPEQPSDNPATPVLNDPTTVVVGNLPLVYALKTVQLAGDVNNNGLVDPGDTLQYTITLTNSGATPATGVVLSDAVPANTTYVANSVQMNGTAVADSAPGVSPLANGMEVSGGTLAAGGTSVVTFRVQVNPAVASGTIISNQGSVATAQLPALLTDADGNPTNGYQPTVIAVGNAQQLSVTKSVAVVGGGAALPGSVLEYTIQATNIGSVPATNVVITDDLTPLASQAAYVAGSATMNGSGIGVSFTSPVVAATYGTLSPGGSVVVRFRVTLNGTVATGSVVTNTAQASWNNPSQTASASASITVGGMPGSGSLNGLVWQDANFNNTLDSGEPALANWGVDLYENGRVIGTVSTGADGAYRFSGVTPNAGTTIKYELRFRAPGAGANTAMLGWCSSPFTNGMQRISNIIVGGGGVLQDLNLPLTPNGVVYNSIMRTPIAGATLTMVRASGKMPLAGSCFNDPAQQGQVTPGGGYYKFDLNFSDPSCPSGGDYLIQVTPPPAGYMSGDSKLIPPTSGSTTASFSVPACPGSSSDAVPSTSGYCEAEASILAPAPSVPAGKATAYYEHLTLDNVQPGYGQIYNNHIAVDPTLNTAIAITKTAALVNATRGQMVPYTITLNNTLGVTLQNLSVVDTFPPGFKYVAGSSRIDGQKIEPVMTTRQLVWSIAQLSSNTTHTVTFLMIVGSGVSEGEFVNVAQVTDNATGSVASGVASATVRVTADPDFDCTDVIGKVFDDTNANGYPDSGEKGLPGVRVVSARGLVATTDEFGRFHITCATVPDEDRGSNFILKLDDRTLPTGYRVTGENPQVQRATRGKMLRYNFGATLNHVISLDIADGVFEPKSTNLRMQWQPRIDLLLKELRKGPSVLRLSYLGDIEDKGLVEDRLKALKKEITGKWDGGYRLTIETEVFWRRGSPP